MSFRKITEISHQQMQLRIQTMFLNRFAPTLHLLSAPSKINYKRIVNLKKKNLFFKLQCLATMDALSP